MQGSTASCPARRALKRLGHGPAIPPGIRATLLLCLVTGCTTPAHQMSRSLDVLHATTSTRFRIEYASVDQNVAKEIRKATEQALVRVEQWGKAKRLIRVRVFPDHEGLVDAAGRQELDWLRAWARYDEIYLQSPRTWGIVYTRQLPELLAHEMTHVLMYQLASDEERWEDLSIPLWFREGMASFTAAQGYRRGRPDRIALLLKDEPEIDPFDPDPELLVTHKDLVYNCSHWAFTSLMERGGAQGIKTLLSKLQRGASFGDAFSGSYGLTEREFLERWRKRIIGSEPPLPTKNDGKT